MMPCLRQFTEISQCHACVNLQRFHDALSVSIYIDFMMGGGGLFASIYRDFTMPCLCQFTEI